MRRIGGLERFHAIHEAYRFSLALAEFPALVCLVRVHDTLICAQLGNQIIGNIARDFSEIDAGDKPAPKGAGVASELLPVPVTTPTQQRGYPRRGE